MPDRVCGMYAYANHLGCCVMINQKHPPRRQRYTLSHEYGHVLTEDRFKARIDYLGEPRKPTDERFGDAFAMAFLMPGAGVRKLFHEIVTGSGDFQVADLARMAGFFAVSAQAMALRLEGVGLLPRGTWTSLKAHGLRVHRDRNHFGMGESDFDPEVSLPERYLMLAFRAFHEAKLSEGELAGFLRVDRIRARELAEAVQCLAEITEDGQAAHLTLPFGQSLMHLVG